MSDIPRARKLLQQVLTRERALDKVSVQLIKRALTLMQREKYVRRPVSSKRQRIDSDLRRQIRYLAVHTRLSQHQIANRLGLGSSGRVSEVLHGKR